MRKLGMILFVLVALMMTEVALCGCQSVRYDASAPAAARLAGMVAVRVAVTESSEITPARLAVARPVLADTEEVLGAEAPARAAVVARIVQDRLDYALVGLPPGDVAILRESVAALLEGVRLGDETVDQRQAAIVAAEFVRGMILEIDAITATARSGTPSAGE